MVAEVVWWITDFFDNQTTHRMDDENDWDLICHELYLSAHNTPVIHYR